MVSEHFHVSYPLGCPYLFRFSRWVLLGSFYAFNSRAFGWVFDDFDYLHTAMGCNYRHVCGVNLVHNLKRNKMNYPECLIELLKEVWEDEKQSFWAVIIGGVLLCLMGVL